MYDLYDSVVDLDLSQVRWVEKGGDKALQFRGEVSGIHGAVCHAFTITRGKDWDVELLIETNPDRFRVRVLRGNEAKALSSLTGWRGTWV